MDGERPKLRVRTGRHYPIDFNVDHGQRNAVFTRKSQTPLRRFLRWADAFGFFPGPGWDMLHTVNPVPLLTTKKHIITFEDYLPRTPAPRGDAWLQPFLRKRLLSEKCVRLVAMSEYGVRVCKQQHEGWPDLDKLLAKTEVLYPALDLRVRDPKKPNDRLRLCFVGADFMRKGGPILVRAHRELRKRGVPVETTIVSRLLWSDKDYVGPPSESVYIAEKELLDSDGVVVKTGLPNTETLRVMSESDYLVFPTFHDTFGFVSIEAMAGATPVITHGTCAQLEIVEDGKNGVLLPLPNDGAGDWEWLHKSGQSGYTEAYVEQTRVSAQNLADALEKLWQGRENYEAMSAAAIARIEERFSKEKARARLEELYELCR